MYLYCWCPQESRWIYYWSKDFFKLPWINLSHDIIMAYEPLTTCNKTFWSMISDDCCRVARFTLQISGLRSCAFAKYQLVDLEYSFSNFFIFLLETGSLKKLIYYFSKFIIGKRDSLFLFFFKILTFRLQKRPIDDQLNHFLPAQTEEALPRHDIPDLGLVYLQSHPHNFHLQHKL